MGWLDGNGPNPCGLVSPNHSAVASILKAARLLERKGHMGSLDGYQSRDPRRAYMLAAAIWSAVRGMGLSYAEPPRSFEEQGQKIRDPGAIKDHGLATCLDTTLLLAAAFEAAGLNPAVVFTQGHAFVGVCLDKTFPLIESDVMEVRKAVNAKEFRVFETTLVTHRPTVSLSRRCGTARLNSQKMPRSRSTWRSISRGLELQGSDRSRTGTPIPQSPHPTPISLRPPHSPVFLP